MLFNEGIEQERPLLWYIIMKKNQEKEHTHAKWKRKKKGKLEDKETEKDISAMQPILRAL